MTRIGWRTWTLVVTCAHFLAACSPKETSQSASPVLEQLEAHQRINWLNQIGRSGFPPLAEATAEGRELRRIVFGAPYGSFPMPGVEIERLGNGQVLLRLVFPQEILDRFAPQGISEPTLLSESAWTEFVSREEEAFRPRHPPHIARRPRGPPPPPPPICHGWIAYFASTGALGERLGFASQCSGPSPQLEYANLLARTAVETRPHCRVNEEQPMHSYLDCFMVRPPDDRDPKPIDD